MKETKITTEFVRQNGKLSFNDFALAVNEEIARQIAEANKPPHTIKPGDLVPARGGEMALIYCMDAPGDWPVHGRIGESMLEWRADGRRFRNGNSEFDLILPKPPTREPMRIWVNVYEDDLGNAYLTEEEAKEVVCAYNVRIAVPFVEVMEDGA